jgi:transcriptional regulator with XRE-family HTH domain
MPKINWMAAAREPVPPPDPVMDVIRRYQKGRKITNEQLAAEMGLKESGLRSKKQRGTAAWTISDIAKCAAALGIPLDELAEAFTRSLEYQKKESKQ